MATPKLILNVPNQMFNELNGTRQFKLNKVPTRNLTRKPDRDTLERFIRVFFPITCAYPPQACNKNEKDMSKKRKE